MIAKNLKNIRVFGKKNKNFVKNKKIPTYNFYGSIINSVGEKNH